MSNLKLKKRKNIENYKIKRTKIIRKEMEICDNEYDINVILDELKKTTISNTKNIIFDNEIKSYRLDNMYNFNPIKFMKDIYDICDTDKIYPLKELMMLVSLCFFNKRITIVIRNFLQTEKIANVFVIKNVNLHHDNIINIIYTEDHAVCDLMLNTERFWFYSPNRFCHELVTKIKQVEKNKEEKKIIKNKILLELEKCLNDGLISDYYKDATLCWIDFYKCNDKFIQ